MQAKQTPKTQAERAHDYRIRLLQDRYEYTALKEQVDRFLDLAEFSPKLPKMPAGLLHGIKLRDRQLEMYRTWVAGGDKAAAALRREYEAGGLAVPLAGGAARSRRMMR